MVTVFRYLLAVSSLSQEHAWRWGTPWKAVHALSKESGSLTSPGSLLFVKVFLHKKEKGLKYLLYSHIQDPLHQFLKKLQNSDLRNPDTITCFKPSIRPPSISSEKFPVSRNGMHSRLSGDLFLKGKNTFISVTSFHTGYWHFNSDMFKTSLRASMSHTVFIIVAILGEKSSS